MIFPNWTPRDFHCRGNAHRADVQVIPEWRHRRDLRTFRICFGDDPRERYPWIDAGELVDVLNGRYGAGTFVLREAREPQTSQSS